MVRKKSKGICYYAKLVTRVVRWSLTWKLLKAVSSIAIASFLAVVLNETEPKKGKELASILFSNAESIAIVSAALLFLLEFSDRIKREHYEAWQVVNSAAGQPGSGGRIQALQDLNKDGVDLEGVSAHDADLSKIRLPSGRMARANFSGSQMDFSVLRDSFLDNANFEGTLLFGAVFDRASLQDANFQDADLREASFQEAEMGNAQLSKAYLLRAVLTKAMLSSATLRETILEEANLQNADLLNTDCEGANFYNADLTSARLKEAILLNTDLRKANFHGANLYGANLRGADLAEATFKKTILQSANLSTAKGVTEDQLDEAIIYNTILPPHIHIDPDRDWQKFDTGRSRLKAST